MAPVTALFGGRSGLLAFVFAVRIHVALLRANCAINKSNSAEMSGDLFKLVIQRVISAFRLQNRLFPCRNEEFCLSVLPCLLKQFH